MLTFVYSGGRFYYFSVKLYNVVGFITLVVNFINTIWIRVAVDRGEVDEWVMIPLLSDV